MLILIRDEHIFQSDMQPRDLAIPLIGLAVVWKIPLKFINNYHIKGQGFFSCLLFVTNNDA